MADNELLPAHAPITGVGPRLKAAREERGVTLAQMAHHTKIPERMLLLMEAGNFAGLPARTYATGFTRSYARALALDEDEYVNAVRHELGMNERVETRTTPAFEPGDPARVPTARFAWAAAVAALVLVAAGLFLWRTYYAPAVTLPPLQPDPAVTIAPGVPPAQIPAQPLPTAPGAIAAPQPAGPGAATQAQTGAAGGAGTVPPTLPGTPAIQTPAVAPAPTPAAPVPAATAPN